MKQDEAKEEGNLLRASTAVMIKSIIGHTPMVSQEEDICDFVRVFYEQVKKVEEFYNDKFEA